MENKTNTAVWIAVLLSIVAIIISVLALTNTQTNMPTEMATSQTAAVFNARTQAIQPRVAEKISTIDEEADLQMNLRRQKRRCERQGGLWLPPNQYPDADPEHWINDAVCFGALSSLPGSIAGLSSRESSFTREQAIETCAKMGGEVIEEDRCRISDLESFDNYYQSITGDLETLDKQLEEEDLALQNNFRLMINSKLE